MGKLILDLMLTLTMMFSLALPAIASAPIGLKLIDPVTGRSVRDATVIQDGAVVPADDQGLFPLVDGGAPVRVRAPGYQRVDLVLPDPRPDGPWEVALAPFSPRALYLSFYGVGSRVLMEPALRLIEETELNAVVIDVKGDRGMIPYRSAIALTAEVGAQKIITVRDIGGLLASLKGRGIYTIARIVTFKDTLLAAARPELAVKTAAGGTWTDREGLAWADPFRREVWDYNIAIAVEAAKLGFDEIQFDYVRFPDSHSPRFSQPSTQENRVNAVAGFLREARERLQPYNVFTAADIFGYVCWNQGDTDIGQKLEALAPTVDYLCPMLYPSGFQFGIPGFRNPVQNPHEIVLLSLKKASDRAGISPLRFRPWLQAFRDYAFDRRQFTGKEIRDQVGAAEKFGAPGWMLWNPANVYTADGFKREIQTASLTGTASNP